VLEVLLNDLGNRSTRHVMTRADMLIVEVTIDLAERFRHTVKRDDATCQVPTRQERLR
jgi:hypothetical protein